MEILKQLNSPVMYLICGGIVAFVAVVCLIFMLRAYKAGKEVGMDTVKLKRTITASATFAVLPSVGILLGVIALSGSLGIPLPWFRLSVVGALHYETQVANAAAEQTGLSSLSASQMTPSAFATIALLMGFCIIWGMVLSIIFTRKYSEKLMKSFSPESGDAKAESTENTFTSEKKKKSLSGFADSAMTAMFIGLVSAYIGSYIGGIKANGNYIPLIVALVGGLAMAGFEWVKEKKKAEWIDGFSIAGSMIIAMASAVLFSGL